MSRIIASHDYGPKRFRWLTLKLIEWMDPTGKPRLWESCERTTRAATGVDAVAIVVKAISSKTFSSPKTILVSQYRPSLASTCYELPAGLIDRGETAETAAFRELQEETGLTVTRLLSISPVCCSDPGMTNTNMQLAVVEVDLDSSLNQNAQQKLGDGEFIDMLEAPWEGLLPWLIKQKSDKNVEIDARLMSFAIGLDLGSITSGILNGEADQAEAATKGRGGGGLAATRASSSVISDGEG